MNIFLAGIHGVGKTYLATRIPANLGLIHKSASTLISEERASVNWSADKRVAGVDDNQIAMAQAVRRYNSAGTRLILDGHFVLLDAQGEFLPLGVDVFKSLDIDGVVLLEAEPRMIAAQVYKRDQVKRNEAEISGFMDAERRQAQMVCSSISIPLVIVASPDLEAFVNAVAQLADGRAKPEST